jgi:hypothetical protein
MEYWLEDGCTFPYFCHGRDLTQDGEVDWVDYAIFANNLNHNPTETTPPSPNPMTWEVVPHSTDISVIAMKATTATDNSGSTVMYNFVRYSSAIGGNLDFGWQLEPNLTDTGLENKKQYGYKVRAKDARGNMTAFSVIGYAVPGEDTLAPEPNPMEWAEVPTAISSSEIRMTAADITSTEPCGVQYLFVEISDGNGGSNSDWQTSPIYIDDGLDPCTTYTYQVKARDLSPNHNETGLSVAESATTFGSGGPTADTNAPTYTPTANGIWVTIPYVYYDGSVYYYHYMTAVAATDAESPPVWYYFDCTYGNGIDSGWMVGTGADVTYIAGPFTSYNHSTYRVLIKDSATPPNQVESTNWNTLYGEVP